jgi:hypothetical protein
MAKAVRVFHESLKEILEYNPETGEFFWKVSYSGAKTGEQAGSIYKNGYRYIQIDGLDYRAARLAWFFATGDDPKDFVDHINGLRDDNRFSNLRIATNSQNQANTGPQKNNTSGFKGISWSASRQKWCASITINGKAKGLGRFVNLDDAVRAYKKAALEAWGEYAKVPSDEEIAAISKREKA